MAIPKVDRFRRHPLAVLSLHLAVVAALTTVTSQAPSPPQLQLLTRATGRTVPTTVIAIAVIVFFVLVLLCVLVNRWRSSSADADASVGGQQGSIRRRRRGLDPAALAALPVLPYAEIRKHKSGGWLECAVCLTAFDDGDELRLLPQCSHAFHPDCIDPWLEGHVTCPLCRANLENPAPPPVPLSSPETEPQAPEAVAVPVAVEDDEARKEEFVELEKLRCVRRAARMPRSRSTGHSVSTTVAAEAGDHERFTVRLLPRVREEVLKSRRLRHATSLGGGSDCAGSSTTCSVGGERCHGTRRRWALLSRTTSWSWAQGGGEGSERKKGVGPGAGTRRPPCGHAVCSLAARWPARCKANNVV
ncbi:hypothetical protein PAHAL_1G276800 [Panicum hallii]|jgi:E3 ubiquitin-protein ligase ATL6/9/15/31/42/55|uniref:RING-type E3 ubiquitin transferase n=1 Tax=Panicum hallii TaxID=206008 RepID=A0A2S3GQ82_9POAL|nr:E3 ubiquitin-protein ligase ATL31-like [Panicum hallii]PAN06622.1 hypothetical protein PAHAL_1G276800 [Panicum hallii]